MNNSSSRKKHDGDPGKLATTTPSAQLKKSSKASNTPCVLLILAVASLWTVTAVLTMASTVTRNNQSNTHSAKTKSGGGSSIEELYVKSLLEEAEEMQSATQHAAYRAEQKRSSSRNQLSTNSAKPQQRNAKKQPGTEAAVSEQTLVSATLPKKKRGDKPPETSADANAAQQEENKVTGHNRSARESEIIRGEVTHEGKEVKQQATQESELKGDEGGAAAAKEAAVETSPNESAEPVSIQGEATPAANKVEQQPAADDSTSAAQEVQGGPEDVAARSESAVDGAAAQESVASPVVAEPEGAASYGAAAASAKLSKPAKPAKSKKGGGGGGEMMGKAKSGKKTQQQETGAAKPVEGKEPAVASTTTTTSDADSDNPLNLIPQMVNQTLRQYYNKSQSPPASLVSRPCALNFYGLPRAFGSRVLPSIIRHILIPNAPYQCDVFVAYHRLAREAAGRSGHGGHIENPDEIVELLSRAVEEVARQFQLVIGKDDLESPLIKATSFTDDSFQEERGDFVRKTHTTPDPNGPPGSLLYFPWSQDTYVFPQTMDNVVKMWHATKLVWNTMVASEPASYARVGMFRADVFYVTAIDIWRVPNTKGSGYSLDGANKIAVIPGFARYPVNDRMMYGPAGAVEVWAAKRFDSIDSHVEKHSKSKGNRGMGLHSEFFLSSTLIPKIRRRGYNVRQDTGLCFLRARVDESVWLRDCGDSALPQKAAKVQETLQIMMANSNVQCRQREFLGANVTHGSSSVSNITINATAVKAKRKVIELVCNATTKTRRKR